MKLNLGKTIKQLRRNKDITQEELSENLGVSFQSVSRWENEICYPDTELLPVISNYFGVTVDFLMGIDNASEREEVSACLFAFQRELSKGNIDECIQIARAGVDEYPNNELLLNKLMYALFVSGDSSGNIPAWKENMKKYDAEIVRLGERLAKYAVDSDIRFEAITRLAFQHFEMGRKEKSREVFGEIPTLKNCRESYLWFALEPEEKLPFVREYIYDSYKALCHAVCLLAEEDLIPDKDAVEVFKKLFKIDEIVFDGSRNIDSSWYIAESRFELAKIYARLGEKEEMFDCLKSAAKAAVAFDNRTDKQSYSSLLLGERETSRNDFATADTRPLCEIMMNDRLPSSEFDFSRGSEEFKDIILILKSGIHRA